MPETSTAGGGHPATRLTPEAFERLAIGLRPQLHRYCARMTGSAVDGEDVLQEALLKAVEALPRTEPLTHPEGWLFRIAHNAALDFVRRKQRFDATYADEDISMIAAPEVAMPPAAAASLRVFMRLATQQRSAIILRDVLGYSVQETADIIGNSLPATKAAIQRGRLRLQQIAGEPDEAPVPALGDADTRRLRAYVDSFNARDFDAVRAMLADDVRLELVNRLRAEGKGRVGDYFHRYSLSRDWVCGPGFVDGRPAVLMFDANDPGSRPSNFVLLDWLDDRVLSIRDFRFARYTLEVAEVRGLD
ncbi:sigma-70 family RNA polymerase sigma factor [soil metagenome]